MNNLEIYQYIYIISLQHKTRFICILQVIIDNEENIVHVQSGFLGHENDANCYRQIGSIRPDAHLKFPAVTFLEIVFIQTAILL
jgi:hypothetical protein